MKSVAYGCLVLAAVALATCSGCAKLSRSQPVEAKSPPPIYDEYDRAFRAYLAQTAQITGKDTITVERLSDRFTVPQKLTIKGTPYEIGLTIGHVARLAKAHLPILAEGERTRNEELAALYRRIYPQQLEIVRGVAAAFEEPPERIDLVAFDRSFTARFWCDLLQNERFYAETVLDKQGTPVPNHHCSVASYYAAGHQIVGRNFDLPSDRPHYFKTLEMAGTYKVMGHAAYDITGEVDDGINEKGFSLCVAANASVHKEAGAWVPDLKTYASHEPYPHPAIPMWHMMQIVMQTCATVDEAIELLRTVRVYFLEEGSHWLLADAGGKAAIVEWTAGDHQLVVFDRPGPYELLTNCAYQEGEDALMACPRYRKARPGLEQGIRNTAEMFHLMRGISVPGTLWTSIMDLNALSFEVVYVKEPDRRYKFRF